MPRNIFESGTDASGILSFANQFGKHLFDAVQRLAEADQRGVVKFDPALRAETRLPSSQEDFFRIITGTGSDRAPGRGHSVAIGRTG